MNKKRVYICCGTGIATSTVIAKRVEQVLKDNRISYDISQYKVSEISSQVKTRKPDIIISSADITGDVENVPVVSGRPFLTGVKKQHAIEEILAILK